MGERLSDVHVAVPWTWGCPHRTAALGWVTRKWTEAGHRLILGTPGVDHWVKADAVRNAIGTATASILVITDADVWTDGVHEAIDRVRAGAPWVVPHLKVHRFTPDATAEILDGRDPDPGLPIEGFVEGGTPIAYGGVMGGGIVVLRRDVYDDCPLDPRFQGWGQEDEAWGKALRCLYGPPARLKHPLWHLWHPPQQRQTRGVGSDAGAALYRRYAKASGRPDQMRALIDEARSTC